MNRINASFSLLSKKKSLLFSTLLALCLSGCQQQQPHLDSGTDPHFKIVPNTHPDMSGFNRKVEVFGIPIYATPRVEDRKLLHAANVMAQYLDNNADGKPDNPAVMKAMHNNQAFLFMWFSEEEMSDLRLPKKGIGQDLGNDETIPDYVTRGKKGRFDASLEEVLHLITHSGYASAYPSIFGENNSSRISAAMDKARGGHFDHTWIQVINA